MEKFYNVVIRCRKLILVVFVIAAVILAFAKEFVSVNYDMNSYLPEDSPSTVALDVMNDEFDGGIPNARVLIYDVTIPEALNYKEKLKEIDGVTDVTWLDDSLDLKQPVETLDQDAVEIYYKDKNALFSVTIDEDKTISAVSDIRTLIGDDNAMTGFCGQHGTGDREYDIRDTKDHSGWCIVCIFRTYADNKFMGRTSCGYDRTWDSDYFKCRFKPDIW